MIYQAMVLGVLLYATETWPAKQKDIRRLKEFHHRCLRNILGNQQSTAVAICPALQQ